MSPREIFDAAITGALAPHKAALAEAAALDRKLYAAAVEIHPNKVKEDGEALLARAADGDGAAMAELESAGGLTGYVSSKSALYPVREAARVRAAEKFADLLETVAPPLIEAVEAAGEVVKEQFANTLLALGELPAAHESLWAVYVRAFRSNVEQAVRQARGGVGAAFLMEGLGLLPFVENEKAA